MAASNDSPSFLSLCKEYEKCTQAIQGVELNLIRGYLELIMNIMAIERINKSTETSTNSTFTAQQTVEDLKAGAKATFEEKTKSLGAQMSSGGSSNLDKAIEQDEAVLAQAITTNLVAMIYAQDESLKQTQVVLTAALTQALSQLLSDNSKSSSD